MTFSTLVALTVFFCSRLTIGSFPVIFVSILFIPCSCCCSAVVVFSDLNITFNKEFLLRVTNSALLLARKESAVPSRLPFGWMARMSWFAWNLPHLHCFIRLFYTSSTGVSPTSILISPSCSSLICCSSFRCLNWNARFIHFIPLSKNIFNDTWWSFTCKRFA